MNNNETSKWFKLLTLFEEANHYIKEGDWYSEDVESFYSLKDEFLDKLYKSQSDKMKIELLYVPYYKFSSETKDKAGCMMRQDGNKKTFDYYLSQVEPCQNDIEIPEKATIEMNVTCENRIFCFHIPQQKTNDWNIDVSKLQKKIWMAGKDFHRQKMNNIKEEAKAIINEL